ncbi:MAG: HNH endonuclease [Bacteroidota bacterium]
MIIKGAPNYTISKSGVITNLRTGRILKINKNQKGYCQVQLSFNGQAITKTLHKLVYMNYIGEVPSGYELNHIDGNKNNNHLENLEIVTKKENMQKAVMNGQIKSGSDCMLSVQVSQIDVISGEEIKRFGSINIASQETGVAGSSISSVINGNRITAGGFKWARINKNSF